jgi:DNA-binding beta-propeller fold protein YncE
VAAAESNKIEKFTIDGTESVFASTGLSGPRGLAFDRFGNLFAANASNNTIEMFHTATVSRRSLPVRD